MKKYLSILLMLIIACFLFQPSVEVQAQNADKTALETSISNAKAIDRTLYTDESLALLDEKLATAETIFADDTATQDQVDTATTELNAAIENLVEKPVPVDKTALETSISNAKAIDRSLYTGESLAVLDNSVAEGRTVYADPNATQIEVNNATAKINSAINGLVLLPEKPNLDSLQEAITYAKQINISLYSQESAQTFTSALSHAQSVVVNVNSTQKEVDNADIALRNAINNLKSYKFSFDIISDLDKITGRVVVNVIAKVSNAGTEDIVNLILTDNQGLSRSIGSIKAGETKTYSLKYTMPATFSQDTYDISMIASATFADNTSLSVSDSIDLEVTDLPKEEIEKERDSKLVQNIEEPEKAEKHNLPITGESNNSVIAVLFVFAAGVLCFSRKKYINTI